MSIVADPPDATGTEGPEGTAPLEFTVSLTVNDQPAQLSGDIEDITVDYAIGGGTATAPGQAEADYAVTLDTAVPPGLLSGATLAGTLTFTAAAPGTPAVTEHVFEAELLADDLPEGDETFVVDLDNLKDPLMAAVFANTDGDPDTDDSHVEATIVDDPPPVLSVGDFRGDEGTNQSFTVTLADPRDGETVTVDYVIAGAGTDPATDPAAGKTDHDYTAVSGSRSGTLTFRSGVPGEVDVLVGTVEVSLLPDTVTEVDETLRLTLTNPSGAVLSGSDRDNSIDQIHGIGTIVDDPPPVLSVGDFRGDEGTNQDFTVTLADPRAGDTVTVDYVIAGAGTDPATDPAPGKTDHDYTAVSGSRSGTLTFRSGVPGEVDVLVGTVEVSLLPDTVTEVDETLRLVLSNPASAVLADRDPLTPGVQAYGEGIIVDSVDASVPRLSVDNTSAREGEPLTFTITLCNPLPGEDVTFKFKTVTRSAAAGLDFVARDGTRTFPEAMAAQEVTAGCGAGVTADAKSLTVDVETLRDSIRESDEEVHLVLSDRTPAHVGFGKSIGVGRIINVSAATVRVSNPTAVEGDPLGFVISLKDETGGLVGDAAPDATITESVIVYYATQDGTATAGADDDYTSVPPAPGPCVTNTPPPAGCPFVTFDAASTVRSHSVTVTTHTDTEHESDETVALVLRLAAGTDNAGLGDAEGTGTIEDADPPTLSILDAAPVSEGEDMIFEVGLGHYVNPRRFEPIATSRDVSVDFYTENGSAHAGSDYIAATGRVTILAGQTSTSFRVETVQDNFNEPREWLRALLRHPRNALIHRADATGDISPSCIVPDIFTDPPTIILSSGRYFEGTDVNLAFRFSQPLCDDVDIGFNVEGITATCYVDFRCYNDSGVITVPARLSDRQFDLPAREIYTDGLHEPDESVLISVFWDGQNVPRRWRLGPEVTIVSWIRDTNPPPSLSISDASAIEGEDLTFDVSLDTASGLEVNVQYRTVQQSGTNAADPVDDYEPVTDWSPIAFAPGATSMPIMVRTVSDGDSEDETFLVELRAPPDPSTPLNAVIVDSVAVGTILSSNKPRMSIADADADEGDTMQFVVTLSEPAPGPVTVSYATAELTGWRAAGAGTDYEPVSGSLAFAPGETEQFIDVVVNMDDEPEGDESFLVELSGPSPDVVRADSSAVGTINGTSDCVGPGDTTPSRLTADSPREDEDAGMLVFELALVRPRCVPTDIAVAPSSEFPGFVDRPGIATPGVDYVLRDRSLSIARLTTVLRVRVELTNDTIGEPTETVELIAEGMCRNDATCPQRITMSGAIIDDDSQLRLPSSFVSTDEGGGFSFVVRLEWPSRQQVTFTYETLEEGTATSGTDFVPAHGTAVIPAGELSVTVRVDTRDDALDENDESLVVRVSNVVGALPDPGSDEMLGMIIDDDGPPVARVSDPSTDEGGDLVFAVTLDVPSGRGVSVPVETSDGTARAADGDYVALASGDVVFAPGETRRTVRVATLADNVPESAEFVWLDLGPVRNGTATIGDGRGRGVIRDTSDRRVSVSDAFVDEGGTLAFEVGFSEGPSSRDVTVRYRTRAGTATARDDYDDGFESATRELKFVAGETSATVFVATVDDGLDEDNETLELVLSSPAGAVIVGSTGSGVIIDNDPEPALSVSDTEAFEADGASAAFTLSLSEASGRDVTVTYSTADVTATAVADYTAPAAGAMETITAGSTTATVSVPLVNDDAAEDVETFRLEVTGAVNAQRDDSAGVATIIDDDGLVQILVDDPGSVYEGDGASVVFTVRLSRADGTNPVTVAYSTADGTATAGSDYTAATSQTLTFAATDTVKTVSVPLINDDVLEDAETFRLVLSSPSSNAELGDGQASVLILDDDGLPSLSVADAAAQAEGSAATFTVTLSSTVPQEVTVDYATVADPSAAGEAAATPGQDYTSTSGTLTIAARSASAPVSVPLLEDSLDENTETFWLRLSNPVGSIVVDGTATGTVNDDDPLPEISIADAGATEGGALVFEVSLTPVSGRTVTVPWTTQARPAGMGAASSGSDYTQASGTLTFSPGTTTAQVEVVSLTDDVAEADETFLVQLGTPTNAALDDSTAVGAIRDDDGLPRVFIADTTVDEDAGPATFSVTLSHPSSQPVTVEYNTADGTATDPDDYAPDQARTLTIPAAFTGGEISVFIADDALAEGTETFTITLTGPVNAVIAGGAGTATGTIRDADGPPRASIAAATATEGDATIEFPVTLSHAAASDVTVRYSTFDGTATQPGDYTATTATLTIPANSTTATIAVALTDDGFVEDAESFLLRLHDPTGLEIATADAVGVIIDDDDLPTLDFDLSWPRVNEDVGTLVVPVSLNKVSDVEVRVDYQIESPIPRTCDPAYVSQNGTLVFSPGAVVRSFEVTIVADGEVCAQNDRARKFRVRLNNPRNAVLGVDNVQVYAWDVDQPALVRVRGVTVSESDGSAVVMVGLNRASNHDVTVTVDTRDWVSGTAATPGLDYTDLLAHTVTVPAGNDALLNSDTTFAVAVPVTIEILDDNIVEVRESFAVAVVSVTGDAEVDCVYGFCAKSPVHIDDDDAAQPPLALSVGDVDIAESAGTALFVARLDRTSNTDVTVDYATADGTATQPGDYTETAGTLTIEAGRTESYLEVPLVDDAAAEQAETFTLRLRNPVGAGVAVTDVTATIRDDDTGLPVLSIADATIAEDALAVEVVVSLSEASTEPVTFGWDTVEVPSLGDRSASPLSDYNASTPYNSTIPVGDTQGWATVWIEVDDVPERDEQFLVVLTDPVNAIVGDQQAWVTILNNDVPIVSIEDATASEGDDFVEFTLNLHAPAVEPGSIQYVTQPRASESDTVALPGEDYRSTSGTVAFAVGETTATARVPINADTVDEPDESFLLVLSDPDLLATSDPVAVGTIVDDDPGFWIDDDRSVWENAASMVFTVQRDHTSASAVTVNYRIGTGGSATGGTACTVDGTDYKTPYTTPAGTVTMPAAATEADISIEICNDDDPEGRENLLIELTNVTGRQTTGVGTIVDDDRTDLPRINIFNSDIRSEGLHDARGGARFQIYADGPLTETVTVTWRTEDCLGTDTQCPNPATDVDDYTANSGTVTLTPTNNSATVTVTVLDDTTDEDSEQFFVRLTAVTGPAVLGSGVTHTDPVGIGFISDDD